MRTCVFLRKASLFCLLSFSSVLSKAQVSSPNNLFGNNGVVLTTFYDNGDKANAMATQPDGKILLAGNSGGEITVSRYNPDGTLDNSFGSGGKAYTGFICTANTMGLQADGKIVVGGGAGGFGLVRLTSSGAVDNTFGTNGRVKSVFGIYGAATINSLAIQPDGKIVIGGLSMSPGPTYGANDNVNFNVARYNPDGTVDGEFNGMIDGYSSTIHNERAYKVIVRPDGKIIASGLSGTGSLIRQYSANGTYEKTFPGVGVASPNTLALQPDGKMLVAGATAITYNSATTKAAIGRYNLDGSVDKTFGVTTAGGTSVEITGIDAEIRDLALQSDGKILAAVNTSNTFMMLRFNQNGSLDNTFGTNGVLSLNLSGSDKTTCLSLFSNKIYLGGYSAASPKFTLIGFLNDGIVLPLRLLSFTASSEGNRNEIKWETGNDLTFSAFTIERSDDGRNFQEVGKMTAKKGLGNGNLSYVFTDWKPFTGQIYYRLRLIDVSGNVTYSNVLTLRQSAMTSELSLFPNPATSQLQVLYSVKMDVTLTIHDAAGRTLKAVPVSRGNGFLMVEVGCLPAGMYFIKMGNSKAVSFSKN